MSKTDLISILFVGVLLPFAFTRPAFLDDETKAPRSRRRWQFAYSFGALTAMSYAYFGASHFLKPRGHLSPGTANSLALAGVMIAILAAVQHLPPLRMPTRARQFVAQALSFFGGLIIGDVLQRVELHSDSPGSTGRVVRTIVVILVVLAVGLGWCAESEERDDDSASAGPAAGASQADPQAP